MEVAVLKVVGAVAGIGGLALGVFVILFREFIRKTFFPQLTQEDAYRLLRLFLILVFGIALAGIVAWVWIESKPKLPGQLGKLPENCRPKVTETSSFVYVTLTWECQEAVDRTALAKSNLEALSRSLRGLHQLQGMLFLRSGDAYLRNPDDAHWRTVYDQVESVRRAIRATADAMFMQDTGVSAYNKARLACLLRDRSTLLNGLPQSKMPPEEFKVWHFRYSELVRKLGVEISSTLDPNVRLSYDENQLLKIDPCEMSVS